MRDESVVRVSRDARAAGRFRRAPGGPPRGLAVGLAAALGLVLVASIVADAQPAPRVYRIGVLGGGSPMPLIWPFPSELAKLGYVEGRNLAFDFRFAEGKLERLPGLAAELVRVMVDLIVTNGTPATRAAKQATATIPIVFSLASDPVEAGLVASLARPGGNLTGFTGGIFEEKQLEMLREAVPGLSRVAYLRDANYGPPPPAWRPARSVGLEARIVDVRGPGDLEQAFAAASSARAGGLLVDDSPMLESHHRRIAELAIASRLPAIGTSRDFAEYGGLLSYGPKPGQSWARLAELTDRILKGAKPSDPPVERPTLFDLSVNLKTAKLLGLTIPDTLLIRADKVIPP